MKGGPDFFRVWGRAQSAASVTGSLGREVTAGSPTSGRDLGNGVRGEHGALGS